MFITDPSSLRRTCDKTSPWNLFIFFFFLQRDVTPRTMIPVSREAPRAALTNDQIKPRKCYPMMWEINDSRIVRYVRRRETLITLMIARRPITLGCASFGNALLNREINTRIVSRFHDFDIYSHFVPIYAAALRNTAN